MPELRRTSATASVVVAVALCGVSCARIDPVVIDGARVVYTHTGAAVPPEAEIAVVTYGSDSAVGADPLVNAKEFQFRRPIRGSPVFPLGTLRGLWSPDPEAQRQGTGLKGLGAGAVAGIALGLLAAWKNPSPGNVRSVYLTTFFAGVVAGGSLGWQMAGPAPEDLPWAARKGAVWDPESEPPTPPLPLLIAQEFTGMLIRLQGEMDVPQTVGPLRALRRQNGKLVAEMDPVFDRLEPLAQEKLVGEVLMRWNALRRKRLFDEEKQIAVRTVSGTNLWSGSVLVENSGR